MFEHFKIFLLFVCFLIVVDAEEKNDTIEIINYQGYQKIDMDVAQIDFALNLFRNSVEDDENAIMSPFSIAVLLAMVGIGAERNTYREISEVLAQGAQREEIGEYFKMIMQAIKQTEGKFELHSANKLYIQEEFPVLENFTEKIREVYDGEVESINFLETDTTASEINEWVANVTNSKITNIVSPSLFTNDSRILLINAVYFKAAWFVQFDPSMNSKEVFYVSKDEKNEVQMMNKKRYFPYFEDDEIQILGIQYKGMKNLYMYIILPREKYGLADFEQKFNGAALHTLIGNCSKQEVKVKIPKFKIEKEFNMIEALKKMGIKDAFGFQADFSGISDQPLFISDVIHKAFINVDEYGTEAAATTAVFVSSLSAMVSSIEITFIADHPFLYLIMQENTILFMGHVKRISS